MSPAFQPPPRYGQPPDLLELDAVPQEVAMASLHGAGQQPADAPLVAAPAKRKCFEGVVTGEDAPLWPRANRRVKYDDQRLPRTDRHLDSLGIHEVRVRRDNVGFLPAHELPDRLGSRRGGWAVGVLDPMPLAARTILDPFRFQHVPCGGAVGVRHREPRRLELVELLLCVLKDCFSMLRHVSLSCIAP